VCECVHLQYVSRILVLAFVSTCVREREIERKTMSMCVCECMHLLFCIFATRPAQLFVFAIAAV